MNAPAISGLIIHPSRLPIGRYTTPKKAPLSPVSPHAHAYNLEPSINQALERAEPGGDSGDTTPKAVLRRQKTVANIGDMVATGRPKSSNSVQKLAARSGITPRIGRKSGIDIDHIRIFLGVSNVPMPHQDAKYTIELLSCLDAWSWSGAHQLTYW